MHDARLRCAYAKQYYRSEINPTQGLATGRCTVTIMHGGYIGRMITRRHELFNMSHIMQTRPLGVTGIKVSSIGLGCVTFGREIDHDMSFAVMDRATEHGINLFDTAESYGKGASEKLIGCWLKSRGIRDRVLLASKVTKPLTADRIRQAVDQSLSRLGTDRIDLYQLHSWDDQTPLAETCQALEDMRRAGKLLAIGVSNFTGEQLRTMIELQKSHGWQPTATIQPPYSLVSRQVETDFFSLTESRRLGVMTYSPLAAGFLTGKYTRAGGVPVGTRFDIIPGHQNIYFSDKLFDIVEQIKNFSERIDQPMTRVALSWVMHRPHVTSVLIGARDPAQVDQAINAQALRFTEDQLAELDAISSQACV